jgi:hypothetical protein
VASVAAEGCILHLTTPYLEVREADSHTILEHPPVQDMILLGPEMVHQIYGAALDSQVAEVAALVGIRSVALAAVTSFDIVDGSRGQSMEQAFCITGAIMSRGFGSTTTAIDEVCSFEPVFNENAGHGNAHEQR